MIIVGHQPQYLPYIGIFNKIAKADKFIFVENIQFNKKSWQNRTLIKMKKGGTCYLTIPVYSKGNFFQNIKDAKIVKNNWRKKHLKTIEQNYNNCIGFNDVFPKIIECYNRNSEFLIDLTIPLMEMIMKILNINIPIFHASQLNVHGTKTELLVDICKKTKCHTYLSGMGAKNYFNPEVFKRNSLNHKFNLFSHPKYTQLGDDFVEGIAIIDLLFNEGVNKSNKIFWDNVYEDKTF